MNSEKHNYKAHAKVINNDHSNTIVCTTYLEKRPKYNYCK